MSDNKKDTFTPFNLIIKTKTDLDNITNLIKNGVDMAEEYSHNDLVKYGESLLVRLGGLNENQE